jgi:hypothetical protein
MKTIQEMAQKATGATGTLLTCSLVGIKEIEAFDALVREEAIAETNAKANASWTLMCEKMVAIEREACAKVCEEQEELRGHTPFDCAIAIRARSNT